MFHIGIGVGVFEVEPKTEVLEEPGGPDIVLEAEELEGPKELRDAHWGKSIVPGPCSGVRRATSTRISPGGIRPIHTKSTLTCARTPGHCPCRWWQLVGDRPQAGRGTGCHAHVQS